MEILSELRPSEFEQPEPVQSRDLLPNVIAKRVQEKNNYICTPIDDAGKGVKLLVYAGGVYKPIGESVARTMAHSIMGDKSRPDKINSIVELVKENTKIDVQKLNRFPKNLINVRNGMLNWETGELFEHSPDYLSTFQINAEFRPDAEPDVVLKFLNEVFPPDALILAEQILGYLMLPQTKYQKAFMLLGDGANGKSTFLAMLSSCLGEENISRVSLQDLVSNRFVTPELQNKLANIYPDLPSTALEQSDIFKAIVAGDSIKAERKFGQPFKLNPYARLLFSANELPRSNDITNAFFRRWIIIPFPNRFDDNTADKEILEKLIVPNSLSALLNMALHGLRELESAQRFSDCPSVQQAGEQYKKQCDSAYEFINETLQRSDTWLKKAMVYTSYKSWCDESGVKSPASQKSFNKRLKDVLGVVEATDRTTQGKAPRIWKGLGWRNDGEPLCEAGL